MNDDTPQQPICVYCALTGAHHLCVARWSDRHCECPCRQEGEENE